MRLEMMRWAGHVAHGRRDTFTGIDRFADLALDAMIMLKNEM